MLALPEVDVLRLLPLLLIACGGTPARSPADGSPDEEGDTGIEDADTAGPLLPDLLPSQCEGPAYDWLPLDRMGELVEHEQDLGFSLPASAIQALVESQGYGGLVEVRNGVKLYRVRHLTQDRGELVEVTGFVAFPDIEEQKDLPILLWTHPTMGFADACAPTAIGIEGAAFPVLFASLGYVVAAPDYIGMNGWGEPSDRMHPWVVAEPTAIASLDAVRAALRLQAELNLPARPDPSRVVPWGVSQGGHAALWAGRYARGYAPELGIMGVVAAVPPTDLAALSIRGATVPSETTLGLAGGIVAAWAWHGEVADLGEVLQPEVALALPALMQTECSDFSSLSHIDTIEEVYTPAVLEAASAGDLSSLDPWSCYLEEGSILRNPGIPIDTQVPVLLLTGEADDLSWAPPVRADAQDLCDLGVPVEYIECAGKGHVNAAIDSMGYQIAWIEARLAGEAPAPCIIGEPQACELPER